MDIFIALLIFSAIGSLILAIVAWLRRTTTGAKTFTMLMVSVAIWCFGYALELSATGLDGNIFWSSFQFLGIVTIPAAWLVFALQYTQRRSFVKPQALILLTIEPIIVLFLVLTNHAHHFIWQEFRSTQFGSSVIIEHIYGPGFWLHTAYSYLLLLMGTVLIIQGLFLYKHQIRGQVISLIIGVLTPWVSNFLYLTELLPLSQLDWTPFAFTISGLAISWSLFRYNFLEVIPVAYNALITNMSDGVIILDLYNHIVDLNPVAMMIFQLSESQAIGKDAQEVFSNCPIPIYQHLHIIEGKAEIASEEKDPVNHYDLRISPIKDKRGHLSGRLFVLRDITDRIRAEQIAHRRGMVLEAVNLAATRMLDSSTWEEPIPEMLRLLGEAAQVSRVYIFENFTYETGEVVTSQRFEWVAPGITPQMGNPDLQNFPYQAMGFSRWVEVLGAGAPIYGLVEEFPETEREVLRQQQIQSIAVIPIFVQDIWWGFIGFDDCLSARGWTKMDLDSLTTAASVIASGIHRRMLDQKLQQTANEFTILYQTSLDVVSSRDLPHLIQTIVRRAVELLHATSGCFFLCDWEKRVVECIVSYNTVKDYTGMVLKFGEGASGTVAVTGKPLIIDDYRIWSNRSIIFEEEQPFRSVICSPLIWQGEVIGVIHVLHDHKVAAFNQEDLKLLNIFANYAAIALHNAQMYLASEDKAYKLYVLTEISKNLLEIEDSNQILHFLPKQLMKMFNASRCCLFVRDDQGNYSYFAGCSANDQAEHQINPEPAIIAFIESLIELKKPLFIEDVTHNPHLNSNISTIVPISSLLAVPLKEGDDVFGAVLIGFENPHIFNRDEVNLGEQVSVQIALALERIQLTKMERRRAEELDALRADVADISTVHEIPSLLHAILERATSMLDATGGDIGLYDEEKGEIRIFVSHNMGRDYAGTIMKAGEGAMGLAIQTNQIVIIDNYVQWEGRSHQFDHGEWHAVMAIPLRFRQNTLGALAIFDKNPERRFSFQDQQLLELFGKHASIAIENARLYENEKQRVKELSILFESSSLITKSIDQVSILNTTAEQMVRALNNTSTHVLTCDLERKKATVLAEFFSPHAHPNECISDLNGTYDLEEYPQTLQAILSRKPLSIQVDDPNIDPQDRIELTAYGIKSSLIVPMVSSDRILGYMELWESRVRRVWEKDEITLAQTIANQAAVALENALLYSEMKLMAITDPLTGAYNRRGLFEMGQREIYRSQRYGEPLSAIMLDIDHYKHINDQYGHAGGDEVLRNLTKICRSHLREIDILGRYGGEEFVILLPETNKGDAFQIAKRIHQVISKTPIKIFHDTISISVSMGVSCNDAQMFNLAVLIDQADEAMYFAKQTGRNRVVDYPITQTKQKLPLR